MLTATKADSAFKNIENIERRQMRDYLKQTENAVSALYDRKIREWIQFGRLSFKFFF